MGGYVPYPQSEFSGLNLRDSVDSVGTQCIDCLNIDLDNSGTSVRSRDGYGNYSSAANVNNWAFITRFRGTPGVSAFADVLVVSDSAALKYIDGLGGANAISADAVTDAVAFGTPSSYRVFMNRGDTNTLMYIHDVGVGVVRQTPTATVDGVAGRAMPMGGVMTLQDTDNRLVVAAGASTGGPNGVASSPSHVWFSSAGDPLAWSSTNYVQLTPGDGEIIQAVCTWRSNVFVFKKTRMFVFYGNSTDASGNPVFNYRTIDLPSGLVGKCVTVGEDGVYYVAANGVYVTTGDIPSLLSTDLAPMGTDATLPAYLTGFSGRWVDAQTIHFSKRRLYVSLKNASTPGTLVYDLDADNWFVWSIKPAMFLTWGGESSQGLLYFVGDTIGKHVYRFKSSFTSDAGTNISSYYQTGFNDLGQEVEKTVAETQLWGTGTVNFKRARDFGSLDTGEDITLGASPAVANARSLQDKTGTLFSHRFASVSGGAWKVLRCTPYLREDESPGSKRS